MSNLKQPKNRPYGKFEMNFNIFKYRFKRFFLWSIPIILVSFIIGFISSHIQKFGLDTLPFSKRNVHILIWSFAILFVLSTLIFYLILIFRNNPKSKSQTLYKYLKALLFIRAEHFPKDLNWLSLIYTSLFTFLNFIFSILFFKDEVGDLLVQFFRDSNPVLLFIGTFLGVYGLLATLVVLRNQNTTVYGFERFIDEVIEFFDVLIIESTIKKEQIEVFIVDFHPFIGIKSLGQKNPYYQKYLNKIEEVAKESFIHLNIICYEEAEIIKSFGNLRLSHSFLKDVGLTIENAILKMSEENDVSVWRTNEIGPYHFILSKNIAFEYLVVPYDKFSNKNYLVGSKTVDTTKIDFLFKTANDIISGSIKPIDKTASVDLEVLDLLNSPINKFTTKYNQYSLKQVKLRFQFEEGIDGEATSVINHKKGYYPNDIEDFFDYDDNFKLFITSNANQSFVKVQHTVNGSIITSDLFHFDNDSNGLIFLEHRTIERSIVRDNVFLKLKFVNSNLFKTEFSHKTKIKLWN